jgi:hypothetical protein
MRDSGQAMKIDRVVDWGMWVILDIVSLASFIETGVLRVYEIFRNLCFAFSI